MLFNLYRLVDAFGREKNRPSNHTGALHGPGDGLAAVPHGSNRVINI